MKKGMVTTRDMPSSLTESVTKFDDIFAEFT